MKTIHNLSLTMLGIIICSALSAQTICTGESLIFRETFGTQDGILLDEGRTVMKPMRGTEPESGEYTIVPNSQARPEWHNSTDHTGDPNGQMMVINTGYADGDYFLDTISGLSTGTYYMVSLFVMNVNPTGSCGGNTTNPRLKIEVEYLSSASIFMFLSSFTSPLITQTDNPSWVKINSGFILPPGTGTIRYRIINDVFGDCGNSLALDDISFSQCASLSTLPSRGLKIKTIESLNGKNMVQFSTESEAETSYMELQKSPDGSNWITCHRQAAAGNSDRYKAYTATDNLSGTYPVYYRIRQVDAKGGEMYSAIVRYEQKEETGGIRACPNPFNSQLQLNIQVSKTETCTLVLHNQAGLPVQKQLFNARKGLNVLTLETSRLAQGTYLASIRDSNGSVIQSIAVIKQ